MAPLKTLIIVLIVLMAVMALAYALADNKDKSTSKFHVKQSNNHKCTSCAGLDNLSDPVYNVKEVIKQSVLLEEHLTQKNKRCQDCSIKHFYLITGYITECVSLAGSRVHEYPLIEECVGYYQGLFDEYLNHRWEEAKLLEIADKLRAMRKKLVAAYFLKEKDT